MRFGIRRRLVIRRVAFGVLAVACALLQSIPLLPTPFGICMMPLVPLAVLLAAYEQGQPAVLFSVLGGVCWDVTAPGLSFYGVGLGALAAFCAVLFRYRVNRNALSLTVFAFGGSVFTAVLHWLGSAFSIGFPAAWESLLLQELPSVAYTMLALPILYMILRMILKATARKRGGVRVA